LTVAAVGDGRPGHEKQTRAVIDALSDRTDLTVTWQSLPAPGIRVALRNWASLVFGLHGLNPLPAAGNPDLAIGAGSYTHAALLLYKRRQHAKAVVCMSPDRLLTAGFDLCLVPRHDGPKPGKNIFVTLGPPCSRALGGPRRTDAALVLVGGIDAKSHHWDTDLVLTQVSGVISRDPRHWVISSSPRTPQDTVNGLMRLAEGRENAAFFRAQDTPRGWVEQRYAESHTVWVTADSISMVYEALTAGCRVGIFPVRWRRPRGKFQDSIRYLVENRLALSYESWLAGNVISTPPAPLNEAGRCAREILRRWWPERLR
jgi:mitochondrial fission protein ELM1